MEIVICSCQHLPEEIGAMDERHVVLMCSHHTDDYYQENNMGNKCHDSSATDAVIAKFLATHHKFDEIRWSDYWLEARLNGDTEFRAIREFKDRPTKDLLIQLERDLSAAEHEACTCKTLIEHLENHPVCKHFFPGAYYNKDGDQLEVFWSNESCFCTELQGKYGYNVMGVMRSNEVADADVCGVTIYSIKALLKEAGYKIVPIEE